MGSLVEFKRHRVFTLSEAQDVIQIVNKITKHYASQVEALIKQADLAADHNTEKAEVYEQQINALVESWQNKVEKLGGLTRGLWLADFDSGNGYYCWKFPEAKVEYWHGYSDGFSGRKKLSDTETDRMATQSADNHL